MLRQGNIQEVLMVMAPELIMTHVDQIRKNKPDATDGEIVSKMIADAYAACICFNEEIMSLNYDEVVFLEFELSRMARRSIEYHNRFMELQAEWSAI